MKEDLRNVCIAAAVVRIKCRSIGVDEAIQTAADIHMPAATLRERSDLRRDVESVLAGKWPRGEQQLEIAI